MGLLVTCDSNRLIIGFIATSECMVNSLNLVHKSKLNTIRNKSTVVVVNGMNLFIDPFLQEFPRNKELLKLRDSTELAQNTTQHCDHDQLSIGLNDKSECTVAPLDVDSQNKLNIIQHKSTVDAGNDTII